MPRVRSREMVGRDRELALLLELADAARAGRPRLALVTGEAGIGKSRLVQELRARISDAVVVTGHGVDLATADLPFGVLADSLADLVRQRGVDVLVPDERALLGPLLPGATGSPSDPARLLAGAASMFGRLAAAGLVCWFVEDLQWADEASRDVVSVLSRREAGSLLVIATVRDGGLAETTTRESFTSYFDELSRSPAAETIRVERLGADDVRRQLAGLLDEPLPAEVVRHIVEVGDGVPFVVEELASARGRPGLGSVSAVAHARLASLSGSARRLVEAAAIGGGQHSWALLEHVVGLEPDVLDAALLGAVQAGILETDAVHDGVRFRHALLRDAANRSIPPAARRSWHRRWAEAINSCKGVMAPDLAAVAVAGHWHEAGDAEQAVLSALAAVGPAARTGGGPEELALWRRLLDLWDTSSEVLVRAGVDRHLILNNVLRLAMSLGGAAGLEVLQYEEARALDELERAAIRLRIVTDARAKGSLRLEGLADDQAAEWERLFRSALPEPLARGGIAYLSALLPPDAPRSGELLAQARALAEQDGDEGTTMLIGARQAYLWQAQGRPDLAAAELERMIGQARAAGTFEMWSAEGNLIWCLGVAGRYAEAERVFAQASSRVPDPQATGVHFEHLVENITYCWINTGQWSRAEELIRTSRPFWGSGTRSAEVRLAEIELLRGGRLSDPARWRAAVQAEPVPSGADPDWIVELLAWDAAERGELEKMRGLVERTWSHEKPSIATDILWSPVVRALRYEVDAAQREAEPGDRSAAEAHVAVIEAVAAQLHRFGALGHAWDAEVRAQLARFRKQSRPELFAAAAQAWDDIGHPYDGAVARLGLAEAEVAEDRDAARRHAEGALATARDLGSLPLMKSAEEILKRYRLVSRGGETVSRPGALTARELEVLAVLAEGRTNEQIAAELYMSPKTASVHVSRIIAKLGVANRTEAVAVARRAGLL